MPRGSGSFMKFMVIETFQPGCRDAVYERFRAKGRLLPEGLHYIDSWVEKDGDRCFQLMETDEPELFDNWITEWRDLVSFEIVPVNEKE
ncbi:MAG TPA: DUF3303 family protein [Chthoniobacterales bacterium]|nr:DUF3303 family protein [Chthoniobacterales bacterium]